MGILLHRSLRTSLDNYWIMLDHLSQPQEVGAKWRRDFKEPVEFLRTSEGEARPPTLSALGQ